MSWILFLLIDIGFNLFARVDNTRFARHHAWRTLGMRLYVWIFLCKDFSIMVNTMQEPVADSVASQAREICLEQQQLWFCCLLEMLKLYDLLAKWKMCRPASPLSRGRFSRRLQTLMKVNLWLTFYFCFTIAGHAYKPATSRTSQGSNFAWHRGHVLWLCLITGHFCKGSAAWRCFQGSSQTFAHISCWMFVCHCIVFLFDVFWISSIHTQHYVLWFYIWFCCLRLPVNQFQGKQLYLSQICKVLSWIFASFHPQ